MLSVLWCPLSLLNATRYVLCLDNVASTALSLHTPKAYKDSEASRFVQVRLRNANCMPPCTAQNTYIFISNIVGAFFRGSIACIAPNLGLEFRLRDVL